MPMYLYNVTVGIDPGIETEWIHWMKNQHIPDIINTGMFADYKMYKVLHDNNDGSISYSVQYFSDSLDKVVKYLKEFAPTFVEEHRAKFRDKHVAFRTLLEEV